MGNLQEAPQEARFGPSRLCRKEERSGPTGSKWTEVAGAWDPVTLGPESPTTTRLN